MSASSALAAIALIAASIASPVSAQPLLHDAEIESVTGLGPRSALARFGGGDPGVWIGWSVDALPDHAVCCHRLHGEGTCSLASESRGWSSHDAGDRGPQSELYLLAETGRGGIVDLRLVSPGCRVDGAGRRVVWLGPIAAESSLDLLESLLDARDPAHDLDGRALAAIAYHATPRVDELLESRAFDAALDRDAREQALFWAGNLRGERGYLLLDRFLDAEEDSALRAHAVFALTQSSHAGAIARVRRVSAGDRDAEVRSQALFWLAQSDAPGTGAWILDRMQLERDGEVRERAVFALSQLDDGADWLLRLMRSSRDPEVVRQALFWLGQSDDPRALAELERILAD